MEAGSELSKTVATFILQKILLDDSGLSYICQTYDRFSHVAIILVSCVLDVDKHSWSYTRERGRTVVAKTEKSTSHGFVNDGTSSVTN